MATECKHYRLLRLFSHHLSNPYFYALLAFVFMWFDIGITGYCADLSPYPFPEANPLGFNPTGFLIASVVRIASTVPFCFWAVVSSKALKKEGARFYWLPKLAVSCALLILIVGSVYCMARNLQFAELLKEVYPR